MGCAFEDCGDPTCPVCSVPRRFKLPAEDLIGDEPSDLKDSAPALNGTKARPVRDPAKIKRNRKPLRP